VTVHELRSWLVEVVRPLVNAPEAVAVVEAGGTGNTVRLEVCAAEADLGRLVGRGGVTIRAIRELAQTAGGRSHLRVLVDVPGTRSGPRRSGP